MPLHFHRTREARVPFRHRGRRRMKSILIRVDAATKAQLDERRRTGYSLVGFIRAAISRALSEADFPAGHDRNRS